MFVHYCKKTHVKNQIYLWKNRKVVRKGDKEKENQDKVEDNNAYFLFFQYASNEYTHNHC